MATIQFKKGDDYLAKLSKLAAASRYEVIGGAIYDAADIVTDSIKSQLRALPTDSGYGTQEHPLKGPNKAQKKALIESLGIAKMRNDGTGYVDVKIGFDGYNSIKTKRWPKGQPNQMVARSIERGTSWMTATPFVKKGIAQSRKKALELMRQHVDEACKKIMEE